MSHFLAIIIYPEFFYFPIYDFKGQRAWGVVKVGTLDCPNNFPPNAHLHVTQKVSCINIPDVVPTFDEGYDLQAVWPKESYARLQKFF